PEALLTPSCYQKDPIDEVLGLYLVPEVEDDNRNTEVSLKT
ncbi:2454_t:CDS:1, partial [Dentiscutata heterogama]